MYRNRIRPVAGAFVALVAALAGFTVAASRADAICTATDCPTDPPPHYHVIQNTGNFLCLQPINGSTAAGDPVVQVPCDNGFAQDWQDVPVNGGTHLVNRWSGLCLDARGGAADGTPVQQWPCNTISNEKWSLGGDELGSPIVSRVSGTSSHCLDVPWNDPSQGLAMQIWRCNGTAAQSWSRVHLGVIIQP